MIEELAEPDMELEAIRVCANALASFDEPTRARILAWLNSRYGKKN